MRNVHFTILILKMCFLIKIIAKSFFDRLTRRKKKKSYIDFSNKYNLIK